MRWWRVLTGVWSLALAAGSGLLTWAAFPPLDAWWAAPLGMAGLFLATARAGWLRAAARAFAFGCGLFTPLLHFTAVSMGNPIGWGALTVFESLYWAGAGISWSLVSALPWLSSRRRRSHALARAVAFAVVVVAWEEVRCRYPWGGFPYGRLAFSAADAPFLPLGAYLGSLGLSLLIALSGALVAVALESLRSESARGAVRAAGAGASAVVVLLAPLALPLDASAQDGTVRVAAVQGDLATGDGGGAGAEAAFSRELEVTGNHARATIELAEQVGRGGVDLVIWPENAADLDPRDNASSAALVEEAAQAIGVPVLVGAVPYRDGADGRRLRYNDEVIWIPGQGGGDYYRKHRPVPFGEYVPWRSWIRRVSTEVDRIGVDMVAGTGPMTLSVPLAAGTGADAGADAGSTRSGSQAASGASVRLAMGICFEVAYDDLLRQGVREGGQLIVVPTNNASFGTSAQAAQQLAQGRVQAVVHGRSVVQVSTVGVTAVISPKGGVLQQLEPFTRGALVADVGLRRDLTVADRLGQWPALVVGACAALLVGGGIVSAVVLRAKRRLARSMLRSVR